MSAASLAVPACASMLAVTCAHVGSQHLARGHWCYAAASRTSARSGPATECPWPVIVRLPATSPVGQSPLIGVPGAALLLLGASEGPADALQVRLHIRAARNATATCALCLEVMRLEFSSRCMAHLTRFVRRQQGSSMQEVPAVQTTRKLHSEKCQRSRGVHRGGIAPEDICSHAAHRRTPAFADCRFADLLSQACIWAAGASCWPGRVPALMPRRHGSRHPVLRGEAIACSWPSGFDGEA